MRKFLAWFLGTIVVGVVGAVIAFHLAITLYFDRPFLSNPYEGFLSKKAALPVKVSFRKAWFGPGYVAMFETTIKNSVPILVTVKSAALGTVKRFELHLNQYIPTELGAVIEKGDIIVLENDNYSTAVVIAHVD